MNVRNRKLVLLAMMLSLLLMLSVSLITRAQDLVELDVWFNPRAGEGGPPPDDWVGYQRIRDELGIQLNFVMVPYGDDGASKLSAQAAADDLPDLFQIHADYGRLFYTFVDQGLLAPVEDLFALMPERTAYKYSNAALNQLVTIDGHVYAFQEPAQLYKRGGLAIRTDWLEKLGLQAPTNLDELLEVAKAFTFDDPDGNGVDDTFGFGLRVQAPGVYGLGRTFGFLFGAYGVVGAWDVSDVNDLKLHIYNPAYQDAVAYIKTVVEAGVVDPDWPVINGDEFAARWKQGRYGMHVTDFCTLICLANYGDFDNNVPGGSWDIINPPTGPNGDSAIWYFAPIGNVYVVSQRAIDEGKGEAIAKFMEWSQTEGQMLLSFGEEGVNYNLDADNNIVVDGIEPTLSHEAKEAQPILQLANFSYIGDERELAARYGSFQTKDGRTIDSLEFYLKAFNSPNVDTTVAQVIKPASNQADIDRYIGEGIIQFILGQRELTDESWAEFIAGLDGLGVQDWVASANQDVRDAGFTE